MITQRRWWSRWESGAYNIESVLEERLRAELRKPDQFGEYVNIGGRVGGDLVARVAQDLQIGRLFGWDRCRTATVTVTARLRGEIS